MTKKTRLELVEAMKNNEKIDHIPLGLAIAGYAAKLAGISLKEFYTDIDKHIHVQLLAAEMHGYDNSPGYGWADWGGWEFGGTIHFPETYNEAAPYVVDSVVTRPEEVEKLAVPDPASAGMYKNLNKFNEIMIKRGGTASIKAGGVTNVVAGIIGKERLMRWYIREKEAVHLAYQKAVEFILKAADYTIGLYGVENCGAGSNHPLDSNELISREIFEEFGLFYQKIVYNELQERGMKRFGIHICGDHTKNLQAWGTMILPQGCLIHISAKLDLKDVAETFDHKHIITGNVPTELLNNSTFEEVYEAAMHCIEVGRKLPGGFVLMPDCEMPATTPPLNIYAMIKASRDAIR